MRSGRLMYRRFPLPETADVSLAVTVLSALRTDHLGARTRSAEPVSKQHRICGAENVHSVGLRSATKAEAHFPCFRRARNCPYAGVRSAMVSRWRDIVPRNCEPVVEFQPTRDDTRGRGIGGEK
jgi:hypothetical protein